MLPLSDFGTYLTLTISAGLPTIPPKKPNRDISYNFSSKALFCFHTNNTKKLSQLISNKTIHFNL